MKKPVHYYSHEEIAIYKYQRRKFGESRVRLRHERTFIKINKQEVRRTHFGADFGWENLKFSFFFIHFVFSLMIALHKFNFHFHCFQITTKMNIQFKPINFISSFTSWEWIAHFLQINFLGNFNFSLTSYIFRCCYPFEIKWKRKIYITLLDIILLWIYNHHNYGKH